MARGAARSGFEAVALTGWQDNRRDLTRRGFGMGLPFARGGPRDLKAEGQGRCV